MSDADRTAGRPGLGPSVPREISEYDGYWMPPLYQGEMTPDVLAAKALIEETGRRYMRYLKLDIRKRLTPELQAEMDKARDECDLLSEMLDGDPDLSVQGRRPS